MPGQSLKRATSATLIRISGSGAGVRYPVSGAVTRIGRGPENDIVLQGSDTAVVSVFHAELRCEGNSYRIVDCGSTNGTYLDGLKVTDAQVNQCGTIRFGRGGPELVLMFEDAVAANVNPTLVIGIGGGASQPTSSDAAEDTITAEHEPLIREGVVRARIARESGTGGQTIEIVREVVGKALHRSSRRFVYVIAALVAALAGIVVYGWITVQDYRQARAVIDAQILGLERQLSAARNPAEADALVASLNVYQTRAEALARSLFLRWDSREPEGTVLHDIRSLMSEFGAEVYSIPPDFLDQVNIYLTRYQGPNRPNMARALGEASPVIRSMRGILWEGKLPPDLAYMVLVESAMDINDRSRAGCVGLWQFTPATARQYGLRVGASADERLDTAKSTRAAARYIKELILDFGSGSSVMLALAAYNVGPAKVKHAIRQRVQDPIKQRSFWYLYRVRALPEETREYVPKVIAAMIIGRHPDRYGF